MKICHFKLDIMNNIFPEIRYPLYYKKVTYNKTVILGIFEDGTILLRITNPKKGDRLYNVIKKGAGKLQLNPSRLPEISRYKPCSKDDYIQMVRRIDVLIASDLTDDDIPFLFKYKNNRL